MATSVVRGDGKTPTDKIAAPSSHEPWPEQLHRKIERKIHNGIGRKIPRVRNIVLRFLCTLRLDECFFKVIKRRPPIDFLFTKAHCSHIMNFKTISYFTSSENVHVVHCKTIISSLNFQWFNYFYRFLSDIKHILVKKLKRRVSK